MSRSMSMQSGLSDSMSMQSGLSENIVTSSTYYQQALRFRSRSPGVVSVSIDDFNGWLDKNKNWKENADKVIEYKKLKLDLTAKAESKPKINRKSEALSAISFDRELERSALCVTVDHDNRVTMGPKNAPANLLIENSKSPHYHNHHQQQHHHGNQSSSASGRSWGGTADMVAPHASSSSSSMTSATSAHVHHGSRNSPPKSMTIVSESGTTPSVFVRLAVYGETKKQKIRSQYENRAKSPDKTGTFAPKINDNAEKLAYR